MKKQYFLFIFILIHCIASQAQTSKYTSSFLNLMKNGYQEKLYLHIDKPYYVAGDTIWLKGYEVNAATHRKGLSNFIYVELVDKSNKVARRVKIKRDDFGFRGFMPISEDLPSNDYQLRAYSMWMQNVGEDFFFKRNLSIENVVNTSLQIHAEYEEMSNGKIKVNLTFKDESDVPYNKKNFWSYYQGKKLQFIRPNKEGKASFEMTVKDKNKRQHYDIRFDEKVASEFEKRMYIPMFSTDYDVAFFPEGGALLKGNTQFVAFKAIGTDGLSREIIGTVYNNSNEPIAQMQSQHKGMGKFMLAVNPDETYYAVTEDLKGVKKRFDIQIPEDSGIIIQASRRGNSLRYQIVNQSGVSTDSLYFIMHQRGFLLYEQALTEEKLFGNINTEDLPSGIITLAVADGQNHVYSERLFFVNNPQLSQEMQLNQPSYGKRELVEVVFRVKDTERNPVAGDFSLSVTDSQIVALDSLSDNIASNLLLTSDLKGYVEDPNYYLASDDVKTREYTDLLMLTQAWRRFDLSKVLSKDLPLPKYEMEIGQVISGEVQSYSGKPYPGSEVVLFTIKGLSMNTTTTDKDGKFIFTGISFSDSTTFTLQSLNNKGKTKSTQIVPDRDAFMEANAFIPDKKSTDKETLEDFRRETIERYTEEGGHRLINLSEVLIVANRRKYSNPMDEMISSLAQTTISADKIEGEYLGLTLWDILSSSSFATVDVASKTVTIRNTPVTFVLNQVVSDFEEMETFSTSDIENIFVLVDPVATAMFSSSSNPVISVTLKGGRRNMVKSSDGLATIRPLGFQKPLAFYVPKYETVSEKESSFPDVRSTVYWDPGLKSDAAGEFKVSFYTSDKKSDYHVVMEGISVKGEICRYQGQIKIK